MQSYGSFDAMAAGTGALQQGGAMSIFNVEQPLEWGSSGGSDMPKRISDKLAREVVKMRKNGDRWITIATALSDKYNFSENTVLDFLGDRFDAHPNDD